MSFLKSFPFLDLSSINPSFKVLLSYTGQLQDWLFGLGAAKNTPSSGIFSAFIPLTAVFPLFF